MSVSGLHPLVQIDREKCDHLAAFVAAAKIPPDQEESSLPGLPKHLVGNFFLALVAICHQTSPRDHLPLEGTINGIRRRGWDYLFARLEEASRRDSQLLTPDRWAQLTTGDICQIFRDPQIGDRLIDPEGRSQLLHDLGSQMLSHGWRFADQFYHYCEGRIAVGKPNLLHTLNEFRAFNDPVQKKSVFFLALMRNSGLWEYVDNDSLGPPVDYHEVRGHLRIGTVRITDRVMLDKVKSGHPVTAEEDIAIRRAVYDAIMHISERSGLRNPSQLHYLFWNLFRSVCTPIEPQCFTINADCSLPERYRHLLRVQDSMRCPFASFCDSAGVLHPIREHVFETDYY